MESFTHSILYLGIIVGVYGSEFTEENTLKSAEDDIDNALSRINSMANKWRNMDFRHHKFKHGNILQHNEVEPNLDDLVTASKVYGTQPAPTFAPTPAVPKTQSEVDMLRTWVKELPRGMFNMKNRMRLATVFLEAHSKDEIVERLTRAGGVTKPRRSKHGRRRRKGRKSKVAYHPLLRFIDINEKNEDGTWSARVGK